jgi:hypothetical protein
MMFRAGLFPRWLESQRHNAFLTVACMSALRGTRSQMQAQEKVCKW